MQQEKDFHISFFKPTTKRASYNRNLVIWLVSIWAIAIFGFHIVLRIIEKPTPEPELTAFNEVWPAVKSGNAGEEELRDFALSALHVTGKLFIAPADRAALDNGITWATFQLADGTNREKLSSSLKDFNEILQSEKGMNDPGYEEAKKSIIQQATSVLNLEETHVLANFLPFELQPQLAGEFTKENMEIVEAAMPVYLTHNRSVLTNIKFLGFPFHYFYTAVFLLILFIGLCFVYCVQIDKYNKRIMISE